MKLRMKIRCVESLIDENFKLQFFPDLQYITTKIAHFVHDMNDSQNQTLIDRSQY